MGVVKQEVEGRDLSAFAEIADKAVVTATARPRASRALRRRRWSSRGLT